MGREEAVDKLVLNAQMSHYKEKQRVCDPAASTIYTDILNNLERVSDRAVNIAEHMRDIYSNNR